jgi:nitronate monooxygenase
VSGSGPDVLRTGLCDLLGIEVPIVQAPMTARVELALAVAAAGGLGQVKIGRREPDTIASTMARVASLPVGVNFVVGRDSEEHLALALAAGVRIVSFFWGEPAPRPIRRVHDAGGTVLWTVGSAEEARRAEAAGVDVVVAQGVEAGGHVWGTVSTLVLVPAVVDAVAVPVIAAGGIADGRGLAAALTLGAQAAWLGTRFVASDEGPHLYKQRIVEAAETDTAHSTIFVDGWPDAPHRTLVNDAVRAGAPRSVDPPRSPDELETAALYAGQAAALVHDVAPAGELVRRIAAEARLALARPAR